MSQASLAPSRTSLSLNSSANRSAVSMSLARWAVTTSGCSPRSTGSRASRSIRRRPSGRVALASYWVLVRRVEARVVEGLAKRHPEPASRAHLLRLALVGARVLRERGAHDRLRLRVAREIHEGALPRERPRPRRDDHGRDAAGARDGDERRARVVSVDHAQRRARGARATPCRSRRARGRLRPRPRRCRRR